MSGRLRLSVGFSGSRESGGELMRLQSFVFVGTLVFCLGLASVCSAQDPAAPAAAPLSQPAITGPLSGLPPANFDAGLLGKISVNGVLSGGGMVQGKAVPGDNKTQAALHNGQVFIQKADGPVQFYLQAGAYNLPTLATPYIENDKTLSNFYVPVTVVLLTLLTEMLL